MFKLQKVLTENQDFCNFGNFQTLIEIAEKMNQEHRHADFELEAQQILGLQRFGP